MKIPKSLGSNKIVDAVIELRYDEPVALPIIYTSILKIFPGNVVDLPLMELPPAIREADPNLRYQPLNKITNEEGYYVNVGPRVLGFGYANLDTSVNGYSGWDNFYAKYKEIYDAMRKDKIVGTVSRVGVKYVNLFDKDELYPNIKYPLNLKGHSNVSSINIGFIETKESSRVRTLINTEAVVSIDNKSISGEIFDIEVQSSISPVTQPLSTIKSMHIDLKEAFFSALNEDFIESMEPSYE